MTDKVFIYGTLKRGFPNHAQCMTDYSCIGPVRTVLAFPLLIAGPWYSIQMLPEPGRGHRVSGELYEVDNDGLALLDGFESVGQPNGYTRKLIDVDGLTRDIHRNVWAYFKDRALIDPIHSEPLSRYDLDRRYVPDRFRTKTGA